MSQSNDPGEALKGAPDATDRLGERLWGDLVFPDDEQYDETRAVWNGLVDEYPTVIVECAGAADVARGVEFARDHDLSLSVRGGGHHENGAAVSGDLVLDLGRLNSVQVDPTAHTVRIEPGVTAGELHAETARYGLAVPTGSANGIGIGGSTLSGGIGWLRRQHGLGIDALRSVEMVTADGRLRHVDPEHDPGLFWAIRGAGTEFGVVTALEFDAYEVGPAVFALAVFYPAELTEQVVDAHHRFVSAGHEQLSTILLRGYIPDMPTVPSEATGTPSVGVLGCHTGDSESAEAAVEPLREIADPMADTSEPMPYVALHEVGGMLYPDGKNYCWRSVFFEEWEDELTDLVDAAASEAPSPTCGVSVWPMDGAVQHPASDDTAFPWRDHDFMIAVEAKWDDDSTDRHLNWARRTDARFRDAGGEGAYAGYAGLEETDEEFGSMVYADNFDGIARQKETYDPDGVFGSRRIHC